MGLWQMKKLLLFSVFFLFLTSLTAFAYETVILKYPDVELWEPVFYRKNYMEGIAQYVPKGQTPKDWTKAVIIHSYNEYYGTASGLLDVVTAQNIKQNPTGQYKTLKRDVNDSIVGRCTKSYKNLLPQCEILRSARGHKGVITIHYINKNIPEFRYTYDDWYDRVKKASFYESFFRNDRVLNKSLHLEL